MAVQHVLVTGSNGFVGKNLIQALKYRADISIDAYDLDTPPEQLDIYLQRADLIFHLAGVNRPQGVGEYETGNAGFTQELIARLTTLGRAPKIVFSSSIQAELDNPYGRSKRRAEQALEGYAASAGADVVIYRLKNIFGKWCRSNYNSVVATFCYNIAHDLPVTISDAERELELVYIDDVVAALIFELSDAAPSGLRFAEVAPVGRIALGQLAETIRSFHALRRDLALPPLDRFARCLYATYLSYLDEQAFAYSLQQKPDQRGALAEFIKSGAFGQIFLSRTHPGVTRGNHYHHTKTEKFLVLEGEALIRFRHILGRKVIEYRVAGADFQVVDIPPGYTHSIINIGQSELVVLFWASEIFDPERPDTYYEAV